MDKRLREAERALIRFLREHPDGATMEEILEGLGSRIDETDIRAAIWKALADDAAGFRQNKLRELAVA